MFIKAYIIHNNSKDRYLLRFNICEILKKNMIKYQMISQQEEVIVSSNNFANRLQFFYFCFMRFQFDLRHKIGKRKLKRIFLSFSHLAKLIFNFIFYTNKEISNSLRKIFIENEVTKKHIRAWKDFNSSPAEYIMVFEDDIVCKKSSNKKLKKLIKSLKNDPIKNQYIDLAGGYPLKKVIPKNKIIKKSEKIIITDGIYTNTACGYLLSKELIKNWLNHLDKEKFNKNFPIDFLMNYLGDKIKLKLISKHFKDSIFLHGSFNGKVNSWQTVFNFKNNI